MILNANQIKKNIDWLLTNGSAPVRYLTHKHLLATTNTSKAIQALWHEVQDSPSVQEIFGKQEKDGSWYAGGSWAPKPSYALKGGMDPYTPKYVTTAWILPLLGEMGYSATDKRILKACRFVDRRRPEKTDAESFCCIQWLFPGSAFQQADRRYPTKHDKLKSMSIRSVYDGPRIR